ncbi:MAG TPA: ChaN family lipoprotein [Burkholderiales bacterium]|jgi:uncharacterized iron-regulated protein
MALRIPTVPLQASPEIAFRNAQSGDNAAENPGGIVRRLVFQALLLALLAGCGAAPKLLDTQHLLSGRAWDEHSGREVPFDALLERAAASRLVILGETHDNPEHHRLQAKILAAMLQAGRLPALAMEQFDQEHQATLDEARRRAEHDPERIAEAGRFDRKGWRWPDYRPLVELAIANDLPIIAANLSRREARVVARSGRPADGLGPASADLRAALERDLVEAHCGMRPSPATLAGLVEAQRARDARMAVALEHSGARAAVLVAGAGHARRDRGVPIYLSAAARKQLLVIAFVEVESGRNEPSAYAGEGLAASYDVVVFTPRAARVDPCKSLSGIPTR